MSLIWFTKAFKKEPLKFSEWFGRFSKFGSRRVGPVMSWGKTFLKGGLRAGAYIALGVITYCGVDCTVKGAVYPNEL